MRSDRPDSEIRGYEAHGPLTLPEIDLDGLGRPWWMHDASAAWPGLKLDAPTPGPARRSRRPPGGRQCRQVLANSGSYGIYAQMDRHERRDTVTVYGPADVPFSAKVAAPEEPGECCFPPIAACITAAARLMLALLEHAVESAGGTWMFCDTDSMAIIATPNGGELIPCPGGVYRLLDGTPAIKALSCQQVEEIRTRFNSLNPYSTTAIPDLLKLEHTGVCYAISAKRYVVYNQDVGGNITIDKRSEHGLGAYLDPLTPNDERRDAKGNRIWIDEVWRWILAAHDNPDTPLPAWAGRPAISRITVSSTAVWRTFALHNRGRSWADQIKPFNFPMVPTIDPFGYPPGVDLTKFRLVSPYNTNPNNWTAAKWRNIYDRDGPIYRITTDRTAPPEPEVVIVKSYGDILRGYQMHPKTNSTAPTHSHADETPADSSNAAPCASKARPGSSAKKPTTSKKHKPAATHN
jgi:hypothetical protein